ncbi:hypothetical protein [Paracoccus sediminicola]|uniref:hypothetical protein n=1 Tax=Paracoccus sediminicola TaxID=3017783 RepID=UPI0022F106C2|nr:hypothetical protein [Paracoccus sediminicola]WBU57266.1 hypothetical protein PAF18_02120 [Paracoccus sediminicola]
MALKSILTAALAAAALTGCAIPNARAVPDDVRLLNDRLSVTFSNGVQCHVENVSQRMSGALPDCPVAASYDLRGARDSYFGNRITEPYADVAITTADGRVTAIKTPESRDWPARLNSDAEVDAD